MKRQNVVLGTAAALCLLFGQAGRAQTSSFDQWDRNGDGKLTHDELPERIRGNFDRADANSDGFITCEEDSKFRARARSGAARRPQRRRPESYRPLEGVRAILDISYAETDNPRQRLDLLLSDVRKSDALLPVVVFIHGGGWRGGDKRAGHGRIRPYVQSGHYAGVSVGYRLSGEAKWPAQIHDCKAAIRWIRANAKKHDIDPNRIGIWGSSAGGHLVAMLGTSAGVPAMDGQLGPHVDVSTKVTCVVDFFGPTDFLQMDAHRVPGSKLTHNLPDSPESLLIDGPIQDHPDRVATANPITYVSGDEPPFLIMHGDADLAVPIHQSELLDQALRKAGVEVSFVRIEGAGHGLRRVDTAGQVEAFFDRHLRGTSTEPARGVRP